MSSVGCPHLGHSGEAFLPLSLDPTGSACDTKSHIKPLIFDAAKTFLYVLCVASRSMSYISTHLFGLMRLISALRS